MKEIRFLLLLLVSTICLSAQDNSDSDLSAINNQLQLFRQGYLERDTSKAEEWYDKLFYDNSEIIGTASINMNTKEWFSDREMGLKLIKSDWRRWGDLDADIENANIQIDDNLAWISFENTVTRSPENSSGRTTEESMNGILKYFLNLSDSGDARPVKLKLMETAYYADLVLYQYEHGETFVWPIRISAVMQKKNGKWKFRQMHFSYPNRGFPNVRITE